LASPAHSLEGVSNLLEEHLHNSSAEENLVMCRLATAREPLTFDLIVAGTVLEDSRNAAINAVRRLVRSSLIERRRDVFYLQYLVQEAVLQQLIRSVANTIRADGVSRIADLPLVDTARPIHIRETQR